MEATKTMIRNEFDRRVVLLEDAVHRLNSEYHDYFNEYRDDHDVLTRLLHNRFNDVDERLKDLRELASEWEKADD